jgi:hypothetical protein
MKKSQIPLILMILLLTSCLEQTEEITPIAAPKTLSEIQREKYERILTEAGGGNMTGSTVESIQHSNDPSLYFLNIRYRLRDIDIFEMAEEPNTFEEIGNSFLGAFAKIILSSSSALDVDFDDIILEIPAFDIDREMIHSIKIKKIYFQYAKGVDEASDYLANFGFINTLEVSRKVEIPSQGSVDALMVSYRKKDNHCFNKCIDFKIFTENLLDIFKPGEKINFKPKLSIEGIPEITDLRIDGHIELQIAIRLPF